MAKYPGTLESNNPKEFGIVYANEVSGHKTVQVLTDLYNLSDAILSKSKDNTDNDAIGQLWFVVSSNCYYQLINWENRHESSGWNPFQSQSEGSTQIEYISVDNTRIPIVNGGVNIPRATQNSSGVLTKEDKQKLDSFDQQISEFDWYEG